LALPPPRPRPLAHPPDPPLTVAAWQLFERLSTGVLPAAVLNGYLANLQTFDAKLASALALTIHSWFIVFPALVPPHSYSPGAAGANPTRFSCSPGSACSSPELW